MKTLLMSLAVAVLSAPAFAGTVTDGAILGRWVSAAPIYEANGMQIFMAMDFKDSTAVMSSVCHFPTGQNLEAAVEVPVAVAANKITVQTAGHAEVKDAGMACNVDVQVGTVDYSLVGPVLRLNSNGQTLDLNRRP